MGTGDSTAWSQLLFDNRGWDSAYWGMDELEFRVATREFLLGAVGVIERRLNTQPRTK